MTLPDHLYRPVVVRTAYQRAARREPLAPSKQARLERNAQARRLMEVAKNDALALAAECGCMLAERSTHMERGLVMRLVRDRFTRDELTLFHYFLSKDSEPMVDPVLPALQVQRDRQGELLEKCSQLLAGSLATEGECFQAHTLLRKAYSMKELKKLRVVLIDLRAAHD